MSTVCKCLIFCLVKGALFLGVDVLFAGRLFLENDSPFVLTAVVQASSGEVIAQQTILPAGNRLESERSPTSLDLPSSPQQSMTPYTVVWQCAGGAYFSICRNVNSGDYIRATLCPGNYNCPGKRK
ncbi:MAG: hypothetical protein AAGF04_03500 [Chlamydiota bacterium]